MEIICHFAIPLEQKLSDFLEENKVMYQKFDMPDGEPYASFDITEASPAYARFMQMQITTEKPIKNTKFSEEERQRAQWLTCTPITAKLNLCREDVSFTLSERFGDGLAHHRTMTGAPFFVAAPISKRPNQHFFTADETPNHLFCTEYAKNLLERRKLPLDFRAVQHARTGEPVGNLYDIRILETLPVEALDLSNSEETFVCPVCGAITFLPPLQLQIRRSFLENMSQMCATAAVFGWGGNYTAPMNLISHDLFLYLTGNKLTRGLRIEPVKLID